MNLVTNFYDTIYHKWEQSATHKMIGNILLITFFIGLIIAELELRGIVDTPFHVKNHYFAIELSFTVLLIFELLSIVFALPRSVSSSMGIQMEILSLILLRSAFKEFSHLAEPISWDGLQNSVYVMISDLFGGLIVFFLLTIYARIKRRIPLTHKEEDKQQYKRIKKYLALLLLIGFILIGAFDVYHLFNQGVYMKSFNYFYTLLIFIDILIVLIAMRYTSNYVVIFRYSVFALITVMIRLALTSPPFFKVGIALVAASTLLLTTWVCNYYLKMEDQVASIKTSQNNHE